MPDYSQKNRPIRITTPLGTDAVLLTGLTGTEGLSQLFEFQLELLRPHAKGAIPFDQLLGQGVTVEYDLPGGAKRHFHGIVNRLSQGHVIHLGQSPEETFISYRAEVVPQFWLLTRKAQSRIFQHKTVPDILKKVLKGLAAKFEIQGTFQPARLLRAVPRDRLRLRQPAHGRGGHLLLLQARRRRPQDGRGQHARRATPTCPGQQADLRGASRAATGRGAARHPTGRRPRSCAPARSRSGTTASSCRTSTWRPTRPSRTASQVGKVDAQAEGRRQRQAGALRLPRRVRPALRRRRPGRRRPAGRPAEDLRGQRADGRHPHAAGGGRRACVIQGGEQLPAARRRATSSPSSGTSTPTATTC